MCFTSRPRKLEGQQRWGHCWRQDQLPWLMIPCAVSSDQWGPQLWADTPGDLRNILLRASLVPPLKFWPLKTLKMKDSMCSLQLSLSWLTLSTFVTFYINFFYYNLSPWLWILSQPNLKAKVAELRSNIWGHFTVNMTASTILIF